MRRFAVPLAFGLWVVWALLTWFLEGRIGTFSRPGASVDRLIYTFVANVLAGIIGAMLLLRGVLGIDALGWRTAGFRSWRRTAVWVPLGAVVGLTFLSLQGPATTSPTIILNAFAQVFVVSVAEVLVCWSVVAGILALAVGRPRWLALPVAGIVAAILFGVYHFAHTAPFNTLSMVTFLSIIGLFTSVFFIVSQDVYGTIMFHNFMGMFGVLQALVAQDNLASLETLQITLIGTALFTLVVLIALDVLFSRRGV